MTNNTLLLPILIPLAASLLIFIFARKREGAVALFSLCVSAVNLFVTAILFKSNLYYSFAWLGTGIDFSLRIYHFSAFIILCAAGFGFLTSMYCLAFSRGKEYSVKFYALLLLSLAFINGAVLADSLLVMLLFWEGMLLSLFGMIAIGNKSAFKTATKMFVIVGISDLCMMLGIIIVGHMAGTLAMSKLNLPLSTLSGAAFILLMIGAIAKAGSMPFHSWIPDAAADAPLPFMAFMPAALEKLLGIYFLTRISLDIFKFAAGSWMSILLMSIGAITIIFAVLMALMQKDYKKLLSYHAISQVGYMILGIGTALPAGIIGGLFHMINNALYKSGLFLTAGSVEKQSGTTSLEKLGGLGRKMPLTFICFIVTAVSICGVPPFNGFFSKELVYDAALKSGMIFYLAAVCGSFFTAASFLKLGHCVFLGKLRPGSENTKEAPVSMLIPMIVIASVCILFGVYSYLPVVKFIQPVLSPEAVAGHKFYGMPHDFTLVIITLIVLAAAFINHVLGVKASGSAVKAADHFHFVEKIFFDPYNIGLKFMNFLSSAGYIADRVVDSAYENLLIKPTYSFTHKIKKIYSGSYSKYLGWLLIGTALVVVFLARSA